jgi:hypothetical protein
MGGGGVMQYIEIMFKTYFSVVTTPLAYLQDVSEGSKMAGLDLGTWVFLFFVAVLMMTFAVCAVRKLVGKVRTNILINPQFIYKK